MKRFIAFLCTFVIGLTLAAPAYASEDLSLESTSDLIWRKNKLEEELESINAELAAREGKTVTSLSVKDVVTFGKYEQDNDYSNGPEDIEWRVLKIGADKALLVSKYCLEGKQYDVTTPRDQYSWRDSSLREWLNDGFFYTAFSEDEQNAISLSHVENSKSQGGKKTPYKTDDYDTEDKVFLLSGAEIEKYLNFGPTFSCKPTPHALSSGLKMDPDSIKNCIWWARGIVEGNYDPHSNYLDLEPFEAQNVYAQVVVKSGLFKSSLNNIRGVRPALWVSLSAIDKSLNQ